MISQRNHTLVFVKNSCLPKIVAKYVGTDPKMVLLSLPQDLFSLDNQDYSNIFHVDRFLSKRLNCAG